MAFYTKTITYHDKTIKVQVVFSTGTTAGTYPEATHSLSLWIDDVFVDTQTDITSSELPAAVSQLFDFGKAQIDGLAGTGGEVAALVLALVGEGFEYGEGTPPDPIPVPVDDTVGLLGKFDRTSYATNADFDVSKWFDASGNGLSFTQMVAGGTPVPLPTFDGAGAVVFGGGAALRLESLALPPATTDITVFAVVKSNSTTTDGVFLELTDDFISNGGGLSVSFNRGLNGSVLPLTNDAGNYAGKASAIDSAYHMLRFEFYNSESSNQVQVFADGVAGALDPLSTGTNTNTYEFSNGVPLYLGARGGTSSFGEFTLSEIRIYARKFTSGEATALEDYIQSRYGDIF